MRDELKAKIIFDTFDTLKKVILLPKQKTK